MADPVSDRLVTAGRCRVRTLGRGLAGAAMAAVAAQYAPSLVALGQWTAREALPMELCRWQGSPHGVQVALTFDDGPDPDTTAAVLDRLDVLGLTATFFPLASLAEREHDTLSEVVRRGHGVGTHGFAHERHLLRSPGWVQRDLDRAGRVMGDLGYPTRWYRPTYGQATAATLLMARSRGWRPVLWSSWGREWASADPVQVAACVARRMRPGAIVLLHDNDAFGRPGMVRTVVEALGPIAEDLDRRGLRSVTLDELTA